MKGVILACVRDLIRTKYGNEKWQEITEVTGFKGSASFLAGANVDDEKFYGLLDGVSQVLGVDMDTVFDVFAAYWVNEFAPKTYSSFYSGCSSAKEFIEKLDHIHEVITRSLADLKASAICSGLGFLMMRSSLHTIPGESW